MNRNLQLHRIPLVRGKNDDYSFIEILSGKEILRSIEIFLKPEFLKMAEIFMITKILRLVGILMLTKLPRLAEIFGALGLRGILGVVEILGLREIGLTDGITVVNLLCCVLIDVGVAYVINGQFGCGTSWTFVSRFQWRGGRVRHSRPVSYSKGSPGILAMVSLRKSFLVENVHVGFSHVPAACR